MPMLARQDGSGRAEAWRQVEIEAGSEAMARRIVKEEGGGKTETGGQPA